jgi:hypothetical protein
MTHHKTFLRINMYWTFGKDKRLHDFFADKVLYPVEWRIFCVFQHII